MALKVKCKCGTMLKVPSAMADKRVTCPNCKVGFVLPAAKFAAVGKAAKKSDSNPSHATASLVAASHDATAKPAAAANAASAGHAAASPRPAASTLPLGAPIEPTELDLTPSNLDLEITPSSDDLFGDMKLIGGDPEPLPTINLDSVSTTAAASYAADAAARSSSTGKRLTDPIAGPRRGYWSDAFFSFAYPFRSGGNVINFFILGATACLNIPLGYIGSYGWIPMLIIFGWIRAAYLSVVQDTATGSEDLPGVRMEDGFLEDIIKPGLRYLGAYACALLPTTAFLIGMAAGVVPIGNSTPYFLLLWLAAGIFLWPMFVILFSFNASAFIVRLDLIFSTIIKTILPYMAMWVMLMLVGLMSILPLIGFIVGTMGLNFTVPEIPEWGGMIGRAVMIVIDVYFSIVSMRIIGLYYLHFKRRFTMTFE